MDFSHSSFVFLQFGFFKRNLKEKMEATAEASSGIPREDSEKPVSEEEAGDPGCLEPLHKEEAQDGDGKD
ncbi:hypothetical protein GH733_018138 [Mirounga leonina]|nr:hypothetical protein GH733_018138 [Mirounga leonina]